MTVPGPGVRAYRGGRVLVDWAPVAVAEPMVRPLVARMTGRDPGPLHHTCPFCGSVEHGRPYVDAEVHVSVAHAPGLTVVAVSDLGPVGVDVEAGGPTGRIDHRLHHWVHREAVGKALGLGLLAERLPTPVWESALDVPGHAATVVVLSEAAAAEARSGGARTRRPGRGPRPRPPS